MVAFSGQDREDPEAGYPEATAMRVELVARYSILAALRLSSPTMSSVKRREICEVEVKKMQDKLESSRGSFHPSPPLTDRDKARQGVFQSTRPSVPPLQDRLRVTLQGASAAPGRFYTHARRQSRAAGGFGPRQWITNAGFGGAAT
jgi:hypothetical protein